MSISTAATAAVSSPQPQAPLSPSYSPPGALSGGIGHTSKPDNSLANPAGPFTPTSPLTPFMSQTTPQHNNESTPNTAATVNTSSSSTISSSAPKSQSTTTTLSSTPPSSAAMSAQNSQQPVMTAINTFPTPTSIITEAGPPLSRPMDDGTYPRSRSLDGDGDGDGDVRMVDHDDKTDSNEIAPTQAAAATITEEPTVRNELDRFYCLARTPYPKSSPHANDDLLSMYSLTDLAATVARQDPVTGLKRSLRKTYKAQIKSLGISGREREVVHPPDQPGSLLETTEWPAEEWFSQKVAGKPAQLGLGENIMAKLKLAMSMEAGPIPGFDATILGIEAGEPEAKAAVLQQNANPTAPVGNGTSLRASSKAATPVAAMSITGTAEPPRPKRTGKKRRYDEHSFEGYGEGYVDDDGEPAGAERVDVSSDAEGKRGGKKKRKKNSESFTSAPTAVLERGGSYGVGMVGVGSGYGGR